MSLSRDYDNEVLVIYVDKDTYYDTDYKIMCGYSEEGLLKIYKSTVNSRICLSYDIQDKSSLDESIAKLSEEALDEVCMSIAKAVSGVERNGFLRGCNLILSSNYIFINKRDQNWKAELVYLPFATEGNKYGAIDLTSQYASLLSVLKTKREEVGQPTELLSKRIEMIKEGMPAMLRIIASPEADVASDNMYLVPSDYDFGETINVSSELKVIGRTGSRADILIDDTSISREHCCIGKNNGEWFIEDMGSRNGTFVNGTRLREDEQIALHEGDYIKLSNIEYRFTNCKGN